MNAIPRYLHEPFLFIKFDRPSVMRNEHVFKNSLAYFILNGGQAKYVKVIAPPEVRPVYHCQPIS